MVGQPGLQEWHRLSRAGSKLRLGVDTSEMLSLLCSTLSGGSDSFIV